MSLKRKSSGRVSLQPFWREVTNDGKKGCALFGHGGIECEHPLDAHHYIPKRFLRTDQAKLDVRNGVPLCRRHHDAVEGRRMVSPRPRFLDFFLAEHRDALLAGWQNYDEFQRWRNQYSEESNSLGPEVSTRVDSAGAPTESGSEPDDTGRPDASPK